MAFGSKDCAHALGSRTEVRISFGLAKQSWRPKGIQTRVDDASSFERFADQM